MATLNTDANITNPDDFYEALIGLHRELTDAQSAAVNARLILCSASQAVNCLEAVSSKAAVGDALKASRPPARLQPSLP